MLDLNDLRIFSLIAEPGGVARASRALNLPKSTLSRRLSGLEAQLKSMLVERSSDSFPLTDFGHSFLRHWQEVASAGHAAEASFVEGDREPVGDVRVSLSSAFRAFAGNLACDIARRHTRINMSLEIVDRHDDQVRGGFAVTIRQHRGQLQNSLLKQKRL